MFLITCPVTRTDELVADRRVVAVANHPTHIAMTVACPCGRMHVYRTGRRWEERRATTAPAERRAPAVPARTSRTASAREAGTLVPA